MRGFPAENALELFLAGDENGGISRTTRTQFARDLAAVADVEGFAGNAVDLLKRADVGIGDIEHVDVIANAGSVRRGVIRAEDVDMRQATSSGIENSGNDVSFHAMMLAAFLGRSGGVEIAKGHILEPGVELIIGKNLLEHEL